MVVIKGIDVTVLVDGQALQEHDDFSEDQAGNMNNMPYLMTKYLEATDGAPFTIRMVVPKSGKSISEALSYHIVLDGVNVEREFMRMALSELKNGVWRNDTEGSTKVTKIGEFRKPFLFRQIKYSEDTTALSKGVARRASLELLGTIVVKVWRVKEVHRSRRKPCFDFAGNLNDAEVLGEKELKGKCMTHRASLGKEESVSSSRFWSSKYVDGEDNPFAIFTFKYCSKEALQSLLLIPRTPSPTPPPPQMPTPIPTPLEERPIDELNNEELRELARRQQARHLAEREARIKPESGIKAEKGVKTERGIKRRRNEQGDEVAVVAAKRVKKPFMDGEMVDLSD